MPGPSRLALVALLSLSVLLVACNRGGGGNAATPAPVTPTQLPQATATETPPTVPDPTSTPVRRVGNEPVGFQTTDGVTIRGHLYEPTGPRRKVVILAHMSSNDQEAWSGFAQELAAAGIAALTFDFRGYGETGGAQDVPNIHRDLDAAVRFMRARDYPQVYVVGAEMGGTAALKVAASREVAGVVAVSAPRSIMGLNAEADVANIRAPKLFVASRDDPSGAADDLEYFRTRAPAPTETLLYDGRDQGTGFLEGAVASQFKAQITGFVSR
jgi:dienelactone hydrolase